MRKKLIVLALAAAAGALALTASVVKGKSPEAAQAASHREAPLISLDPTADITDFFMFRSYESSHGDNVVLIMDVIPGEEPSSGPNYWNFDPSVVYAFNLDSNRDGKAEDVQFEFRFRNEFRGTSNALGLFLPYVAIPPIEDLESDGLGFRQKYSITMVTNGHRQVIADDLIVAPSNVGPRTMPDYEALADDATYDLGNGMSVFAGQRDDPFYIDLGATFDTLNLRRSPLPLLTAAEDADDTANAFGKDQLKGFNVHAIALEVPIDTLTVDGEGPADTSQPWLGAYASTSRPLVTVRSGAESKGKFVQVQRLANPLVNETIIGTKDKDRWNATEPEDEAQFLDYYLKPRLATALELVFGVPTGCVTLFSPAPPCAPSPPPATAGLQNFAGQNRTDLVNVLLKYEAADAGLSELLRLNVSVDPTPVADQKRLGPLAHDDLGVATPDPAAWPNGRRPIDDVTDVAVRVVGGPTYIGAMAGDGINTNDAPLSDEFPFLATPWSGLDVVH